MDYNFIDCLGNVLKNPSKEDLKTELSKDFSSWLSGSGDAAIEKDNIELIIIKLEQGIFIMTLSDYSAPLIDEQNEIEIITHFIGGEGFNIPSNCICDINTALNILTFYINNESSLSADYQWVDIFDYLPEL